MIKMNPFRTVYYSCYLDHSITWKCGDYFDSYTDVVNYSVANRRFWPSVKIVGTSNIWPMYVKKLIIAEKLKPPVSLRQ